MNTILKNGDIYILVTLEPGVKRDVSTSPERSTMTRKELVRYYVEKALGAYGHQSGAEKDHMLHRHLSKLKNSLPDGHPLHPILKEALDALLGGYGDQTGLDGGEKEVADVPDVDEFEDLRRAGERMDGQNHSPAVPKTRLLSETDATHAERQPTYKGRSWATIEKLARSLQSTAPHLTKEGAINRIMKDTAVGRDMAGVYEETQHEDVSPVWTEPREFPVVKSSPAWDRIEAAASNVAKTAKIRTRQQAIAEVLRTRHDLTRAYEKEQQQLIG